MAGRIHSILPYFLLMKALFLFPFRCIAFVFRIFLWMLTVVVVILGILLPETSRNIRSIIDGVNNALKF